MSSINYNNYTDKQKAEQRRKIADAFDVLAEKFEPLNADVAEAHRKNAEVNRRIAEKLDPPQPEWQDGDLVRDRDGDLWEYDASVGVWRRFGIREPYYTEVLADNFGPLRKVYVSDPSKNQVVVSVDEIYRTALLAQADKDEQEESSLTIAGIRVAKAVREQLADSEDPRDMLSNF